MKAIIYDLDGTLVDSMDDLIDALQALLLRLRQKPAEREALLRLIKIGSRQLLLDSLEVIPPGLTHEDIYEMFNNEYEIRLRNKTKPFPGICDMLRAVRQRGLMQAVVSNKKHILAQRVCRHFFQGMFEICIGTIPHPPKPDPAMLHRVIEELRVCPSEVLYVGDTRGDIQAAENAGILGVGVSWGYGGTFECEHLLAEPVELIHLLDTLEQ